MDIFEVIFGRGLLEVIGGFIRFLLGYSFLLFTKKETKPLSFYFRENKNEETFTNGVGNHVVGVVFFVMVVFAVIIVMSPAGRRFFG